MNKKIGNIVSEKSSHDNDLRVLRYLQERQKVSQRELSQFLGISLGKVNFILKALIDKGIVKARNFVNNKNKRAYAYFLTKEGFEEKARLTIRFFQRKSKEYDDLRHELEELEEEIGKTKNKISDK
tara:strand:- start:1642 stop:2019 length:378 start_codon:yes stop_codon:yes gene_type:complete